MSSIPVVSITVAGVGKSLDPKSAQRFRDEVRAHLDQGATGIVIDLLRTKDGVYRALRRAFHLKK